MGATTLVVGGDGGIGRACVEEFEGAGHRIVVVDRARGHDACDPDLVRRLIADAGPLDNVVHAAGSVGSGGIGDEGPEQWRRVLEDNLVSAMAVSQAVVPALRDGASVVLFGSVNGRHGGNRLSGPAYAAAKAGIAGLARHLAKDLAPRGIRVNTVAPGPVRTPMVDRLTQDQTRDLLAGVPLGRMTAAREIAGTVAWLCSPSAASVTGAVIDVNGGMWMG
ncbi:SDR family NAD(P)-dependent oxidoreductase [Nocardiopsis flavescens]|uniref:3-oxoacyl-[acyl-carrier protein] reductase n=1 Tax=Nocardiopsis flavescens TaxID=758803 RepID=A0A1M6CS31_9ACTN|nr:SDR family oxidoreductase [Nocardiopsis flavescens]SHI63769.1 3-oxoacyl-[acyl-carrier protein] reductase [Nocardiopsis flavescens]